MTTAASLMSVGLHASYTCVICDIICMCHVLMAFVPTLCDQGMFEHLGRHLLLLSHATAPQGL
jgi:hypothetical protein